MINILSNRATVYPTERALAYTTAHYIKHNKMNFKQFLNVFAKGHMSSYPYALQHDEYNIKSHCILYYMLYITQIDYHIDSTLLHLEQAFCKNFKPESFRSRLQDDVKQLKLHPKTYGYHQHTSCLHDPTYRTAIYHLQNFAAIGF